MTYERLFSPVKIGGRRAVNRLVAQAMEGNDAEEDGKVSLRGHERYMNLARGRWGLSVVEAISVMPEARARRFGLVMSRRNLDSYKRLVDGYKKIFPEGILLFQVTHSGRNIGPFSVKTCLYPEGAPEGAHLLTTDEVYAIQRAFIDTARLAEEAGADGIDFKLCHGYFGAEMLRPGNIRADRWGGSFENRTRFIREAVGEILAARARKDFILGSRISMFEAIRGGCGTAAGDEIIEDLAEMEQLVILLREIGMDYLNVSAGIPALTPEVTRPTKPSRRGFLHHFRYTRRVKELVPDRTVIGSAYSILAEEAASCAEENISKGYADCAGFGRQSFADPLYPAKLLSGGAVQYCIACSGCTKLMVGQVHDGCIIYNPYYREVNKNFSAGRGSGNE
jgi:2,4-dienoyl-CoA reductase-like NADH-dependent reductase (Old Yellow Enzyme family)